MRRAAVLIAATLLLAGCGATGADHAARPHVSDLCVDVGLPLSGADAAAGRGVLAGIRMKFPAGGVMVGAYHVALCHVRNDATVARHGVSGAITDARAANGDLRTIAYIGELTGADARAAETVLAEAGIPLITPSGPPATLTASVTTGPTPAPVRTTALYLLPSGMTQVDAVTEARAAEGCAKRRRGRPTCTVLGPDTAPLCTGVATVTSQVRRFCVMAGPNLASWSSPAVAYGDSAGELLLASLKAIEAGGGDIADRGTVLGTLRRRRLTTPIGPIRFNGAGAMEADDFSLYTVKPGGGLILSRSFSTH